MHGSRADSDETSLAELRGRLGLLVETARAFASAGGAADRVFASLVRGAAEALECACMINVISADGAHVSTPHSWAPDKATREHFQAHLTSQGQRRVDAYPALASAIQSKKTFFPTGDALAEARARAAPSVLAFAAAAEISSVILLPLVAGEAVIGVLGLMRLGASAAPFRPDDVAFAEALAEQATLALAAQQAAGIASRELHEKEAMAARLRVLAEASRDFAEATGDFERLLASVARKLGETLGDLCAVRSVNEEGTHLERGVCFHADPNVVATIMAIPEAEQALGEGVMGRVAASGEALFAPVITVAAFADTALPAYRAVMEQLQVESAIAVPMRCRDRVVGVATLLRSGHARPYTEDDLSLAWSIADHAALAIMNARSYAAERDARAKQVAANEALAQSEAAHRLLIEASPTPLIVFDRETLDNLAVNQAALDLYGYAHDEFLLARVALLRVDQDEEQAKRRLRELGDREVSGSVQHRRKNGEIITIEYTSRALTFHGRPARITSLRDVTAHARADATRALLAAIVESSNDSIVSTQLDGTITSWNRAATTLFGFTAAEAVGQSITLIIPPDRTGEERTLLSRVASGERVDHHETVRRRKNGELVHVSLSLAPIRDAAGVVVGASKTARDLTAQRQSEEDLRRAEHQLRQAQKMEAVGRLAGGIAHDFNNVLCVILSYGDMIMGELPADDPLVADVEEIRTAAERAADLTRQLLMFTRQQVVEPRTLQLNEVLDSMDGMLRRILGEDIELATVRRPDLGCVRADRGSIEQVIMNLAVNARDAMPTGGKLTIETASVTLDLDYASKHPGSTTGPHVMLAVTDSGCGMDAATEARVFEPFFTTKEPGRGTGLGLSTVFGIAQQSGGSISVYSEVGVGTTFKMYLPEVDELPEANAAPTAVMRRGTETVLLVEDQPQVRAVAEGILERSGYVVITAQDARDALRIAEDHEGPIDILLSDVVMPQMSGAELARRIAALRAGIKVLCMSGYTDDSVVRHGVLASGLPFLQKPFTPESLTTKLREVLEAGPSRFFAG